jgi:hypothetical protein
MTLSDDEGKNLVSWHFSEVNRASALARNSGRSRRGADRKFLTPYRPLLSACDIQPPWAEPGIDTATPVSMPVQRFAFYRSDRHGVYLAASEDCKIHHLPNAVGVQEPHEIVDAPDRLAAEREDDIA